MGLGCGCRRPQQPTRVAARGYIDSSSAHDCVQDSYTRVLTPATRRTLCRHPGALKEATWQLALLRRVAQLGEVARVNRAIDGAGDSGKGSDGRIMFLLLYKGGGRAGLLGLGR